jgi:hypothetical protein
MKHLLMRVMLAVIAAMYRPRFLGHRIAPYAAMAAG